jgi:hypothetical protein
VALQGPGVPFISGEALALLSAAPGAAHRSLCPSVPPANAGAAASAWGSPCSFWALPLLPRPLPPYTLAPAHNPPLPVPPPFICWPPPRPRPLPPPTLPSFPVPPCRHARHHQPADAAKLLCAPRHRPGPGPGLCLRGVPCVQRVHHTGQSGGEGEGGGGGGRGRSAGAGGLRRCWFLFRCVCLPASACEDMRRAGVHGTAGGSPRNLAPMRPPSTSLPNPAERQQLAARRHQRLPLHVHPPLALSFAPALLRRIWRLCVTQTPAAKRLSTCQTGWTRSAT